MLEIGTLAFLTVFVAASLVLVRQRESDANALWTWALVALLGSGLCTVVASDAAWSVPVGYALGSLYPALLLCGAMAFAKTPIARWTVFAGLGIGLARGLAATNGYSSVSVLGTIVWEPPLVALAASWTWRASGPTSSRAERSLAPLLLGIAALEFITALTSPPVPPAVLAAWIVVGPLVLVVQATAVARRNQRLRDGQRELELADTVARLREQIAERERAERALRESEERYRLVTELGADTCFAARIGPDGVVEREWATDTLGRIAGYSELKGINWQEILHPDDHARALPMLQEILSGRLSDFELRIITKHGDVRWLQLRVGTLENAEDGSIRVIGSAADVTEKKQAERERKQLELRVQEVQRLESLGVLAGGIAHDFNNMLTVILGNAKLGLADLDIGVSPADRLAHIATAASHAGDLTEQMLATAGKASVQTERVDVVEVVRSVSELMHATLGESTLDLDLQRVPDVEADPTQLRQILLNLIQNASDAIGAGAASAGRVLLQVHPIHASVGDLRDGFGWTECGPGDYVSIQVTDSGPGLGGTDPARIFEPFYTTKNNRRGLGLAATLGIVRGHRGLMQISEADGGGCVFRVLLPLASGPTRAVTTETPPEPTAPAGRRVLLVDDDDGVLEVAGEFLTRAGFEVLCARGGSEALSLLPGCVDSLDGVVLDLVMPEVDGEEVFRELRRLRADLPVIISSGFDRDRAAERFAAEDIHSFLNKPYDFDELVARVGDLSDRGDTR